MRSTALLVLLVCASVLAAADLRLGIIGTDTSHVIAFTQALNDPAAKDHIAGARVVAAYKGGSPDLKSSYERVEKYASELQSKWNIEIVPDIASLCGKVDGILLESVDGRVHAAQAKQAFGCRKPVFIDKPLSDSLEGAREIAKLAKEAGVPWFSSSSMRYGETAATLKSADNKGATVWGAGPIEPTQRLDLTWYGVHSAELLYALLGPGCEEVTRVNTPDADVVVGRWKDGRIGTMRIVRPYGAFGAVVFRPEQVVVQSKPNDNNSYTGLVREIVKFMESGKAPIAPEETLEMFAFMDAAQHSKDAGGAPAKLR